MLWYMCIHVELKFIKSMETLMSSMSLLYITVGLIHSEGLAMVWSLQKFKHYLLGGRLKFFTENGLLRHMTSTQNQVSCVG
jgi:hypothetical protein